MSCSHEFTMQADAADRYFHHGPLPNPASQIRLLRLENPDRPEALAYELTTWSIKDAPPYRAVSYTWGGHTNNARVTLNGGDLVVRQNCVQALLQCSSHAPRDYFWIDSICINQLDTDERSSQVAVMGLIFNRAVMVHACVGEHAGRSECLFILADILQARYPKMLSEDTSDVVDYGIRWSEYIQKQREKDFMQMWWIFETFAERPFWSRVWVVQEIAVSRACTIFCGKDSMSLRALRCLAEILEFGLEGPGWHRLRERLWRPDITPLSRLVSHRHYQRLLFDDAIERFKDFRCTDPRDHIYGMQYLVNWPNKLGAPIPDYNESVYSLAMRAISYIKPRNGFNGVRHLLDALKLNAVRIKYKRQAMREKVIATQNASQLVTFAALRDEQYILACLEENPDGELAGLFVKTTVQCRALLGLDAVAARKIFKGGELAAIACIDTKVGDVLIPYLDADEQSQLCLVVRRVKSCVFGIVGQAFTVNGYRIPIYNGGQPLWGYRSVPALDRPGRKLAAAIRIQLTAQDVISLVGQDMAEDGTPDWALKLERLSTSVSDEVTATVKLHSICEAPCNHHLCSHCGGFYSFDPAHLGYARRGDDDTASTSSEEIDLNELTLDGEFYYDIKASYRRSMVRGRHRRSWTSDI